MLYSWQEDLFSQYAQVYMIDLYAGACTSTVYTGACCLYLAAAHTRRLVAVSSEAFVHITVTWATAWVTPPSSRTWLVSSV